MRLNNCIVEYSLANGQVITAKYKEENFPHLIGLHKLQDIQLIQFWTDRSNRTVKLRDVLRAIRNESLTDSDVKQSCFFSLISDRYDQLSYDNLTTLNYSDAIINFNPSVMNSMLSGDYILFEEKPSGEYNHMSIAMNQQTGDRYIESFFHHPNGSYIHNQTIVGVDSFVIKDNNGNVIVQDTY